MKKLLGKKTRMIVLIVILAITVLSIGLSPLVKINYDMREYLPETSVTSEALKKMEEEFGQTSMIQVMTTNLGIEEVAPILNEINKINNVKSVMWLGSVADITVPIENIDRDLLAGFYNDGDLLFIIEFNEDDYSLEVGESLGKIETILGNRNINFHLRGPAIQNKSSRDKLNKEMVWILLITVPLAIVILFLASVSWFEPVIVLINLAVAIVINLGTNYMLPSVSYITMAISSVLQLAMSLDYSLFLIHRYYEERENGLEPKEAAIKSTKDAFSSITASALTTIFGFLALVVMKYKIGMDIGVSLAKAIVVSFVITLVLLPILLITFDKVLLKLKHKKFNFKLDRLNNFFCRFKIPIFIVIVAIGGISFWIQTKANYAYGDAVLRDPKDEVVRDENAIEDSFGAFQPIVIMYKHEDRSEAIVLANKLMAIDNVTQIQSLVTSIDPSLPEDILPVEALVQFKGKNYSRMIIYIDLVEENEEMYSVSEEIVNLTKNTLSSKSYVIGVPIAIGEIKTSVTSDGIFVQLLSALLIAIIIGIALKSAVLPVILVLLIEISIWINVAITSIGGGVVVYIGYLVVNSLQLGATIDYAVLLTGRYQEFRLTLEPKEAMKEAISKSVPAIITSAVVLSVAGFMEAIISRLSIVKEIGMLIGRGALLSGILVIFVLPALLLLFDKTIQKTLIKKGLFRTLYQKIKNKFKKEKEEEGAA